MKHTTAILTILSLLAAGMLSAQNRTMNVEDLFKICISLPDYHWEGDSLKNGRTESPEPAVPDLARMIGMGRKDGIVIGESVSRNEFGINTGYFPSTSGKKIAFYLKNEMEVTKFPLLDINSRTGSLVQIRYPMNGMTSERISLGIYDTDSKAIRWVKAADFDIEEYLTCISWSPDDRYIFIQELDRAQHHMHLNQYDAESGDKVRTILTEENEAWVEPQEPLRFIKGSCNFIYETDNRDGYHSLYLCDTLGVKRRITEVAADVHYVANDGKYVYYTSAEVSPVENHLFRVDITKKKLKPQRLTTEPGWHEILMRPDCREYADKWSSYDFPGAVNLCSADGKVLSNVYTAENPVAGFSGCIAEYGTVKSADGKFDNYYRLFKPADFDSTKTYPLIVYVYGGPHSQMVQNRWMGNIRIWEYMMAQKGYIVYVQDNRGTSNRGAEFEKAINRQCGQAEMADQMAGINRLLDKTWIDKDRVGVHGWSYGGFMTISLMTNYPDVFKVGVAGGPVIDWKWYEVMYGERYMDTPETNSEGFEKTSLMNRTSDLKGKLLICQGAVDKTVVWLHSLSFVQKCIEENVQLDYFPYPCTEHNVRGAWRVHLYQKITDYFDENL